MVRRNSAPSPALHFPSPCKQIGAQHFTPLSQPRPAPAGPLADLGAPPVPPTFTDLPSSPVLRLDALARLTHPSDTLGFGERASKAHLDLVRGPVIRLYYEFTSQELKQRWAQLCAPNAWPGQEGTSELHFLRMRRLEMEVAAELLYTRNAAACETDFHTTCQLLEGQLARDAGQRIAIALLRIRLHALTRLLPPGEQHRLQQEALDLAVLETDPKQQARACRLLALRAGQMGESAARRDLIAPESLRRLRGERAATMAMQARLIRLACEDATPDERQALRRHCLEMPLPAGRSLALPVPQALQLRRLMLDTLHALSPPAPSADKVLGLCDLSALAEMVPEGLARNQILLRGLALRTLVGALLPAPPEAADSPAPDSAQPTTRAVARAEAKGASAHK